MKQGIIFTIIAILFYGCSQETEKSNAMNTVGVTTIENNTVPKSKEEFTASFLPELSLIQKSRANKIIPKEEIRNKIPIQKLLEANVSFTENNGQLERFQGFVCHELDQVKFYSKAFG